MTDSLSVDSAVTASGRNPGHAGGGLAAAKPALPPGAWLFEYLLERRFPAVGKGGNPHCAQHLLTGMSGQVEQGIDLGHGHSFWPNSDLHDLITSLHSALTQHPEVKSGAAVRNQQRGHPRVVHPDAHPVAGDPRLRHFEQRFTDPVPVADAHLIIWQAVHSEVLAKLAVGEVIAV